VDQHGQRDVVKQPVLDEPIHLEPYRPEWPVVFEAERQRIVEALGVLPEVVQHIGSTAVVGLGGKPVLDILIGASGVPCPDTWTATLERLRYEAMGEAGIPGRWYFRHRVPPFRNAHVVELGGPHWMTNLALRDYLRISPDACARYMEAKRLAVADGATSLIAYTRAKRPMIETLLTEALSRSRSTDEDST
jgi:GrpB-like predicted nucleotidyltransferase (UPF0157 family)